jgi:hypothetical protein
MSEFLLLFRGGEYPIQQAEEAHTHLNKWFEWIDSLKEQGKLVGTQRLKYEGKQVHGTKKIVTDGPFAEGKEIVGGYLICLADSFDEAVTISKDCPIFEFENGIVEVRQIQPLRHM